MHPTSAHLRDPHVQCSTRMLSARMLQGLQLTSNRDYRPCKFPFTRDYDGMAPLHVPTSSGLPSEMWSEEMDRFICFSDAVGETPTRVVILSLKKRFPELKQVWSLFPEHQKTS